MILRNLEGLAVEGRYTHTHTKGHLLTSMRHPCTRLITAVIFLMAQVAGASVSGPSCGVEQREAVRCALPCCSSGICDCGMAPSEAPAESLPVAPMPHAQDFKFTSVFMNIVVPRFSPLMIQKPTRLLTVDAFLPHCPPALALHCALLI